MPSVVATSTLGRRVPWMSGSVYSRMYSLRWSVIAPTVASVCGSLRSASSARLTLSRCWPRRYGSRKISSLVSMKPRTPVSRSTTVRSSWSVSCVIELVRRCALDTASSDRTDMTIIANIPATTTTISARATRMGPRRLRGRMRREGRTDISVPSIGQKAPKP